MKNKIVFIIFIISILIIISIIIIYKKQKNNIYTNFLTSEPSDIKNNFKNFEKDWEKFIFSNSQNISDYYGNQQFDIYVGGNNTDIIIGSVLIPENIYKLKIKNLFNTKIQLKELGVNSFNFYGNRLNSQDYKTYDVTLSFSPKKKPFGDYNKLFNIFFEKYPQYIVDCCRIENDIQIGSLFSGMCIQKKYIESDGNKSDKCDDVVSKYCANKDISIGDPLCGCYNDDEKDYGWMVYNYLNSDPNTESIAQKPCLIASCNNNAAYKSKKSGYRNINCAPICAVIEKTIAGDNTIIIKDIKYKLNCSANKIPPFNIIECSSNNDCKDGKICDDYYKCVNCKNNAECKDGRICNVDNLKCTNCIDSRQCDPNNICEYGICKPITPKDCTKDSDCENKLRICDLDIKKCKDPPPLTCNIITDCKKDEICSSDTKTCIYKTPTCSTNTDCKKVEMCDLDTKTCIYKTPTCSTDTDCKKGEMCDLDKKICKKISGCTKDLNCKDGERCDLDKKICKKISGCSTDSDCKDEEKCDLDKKICKKISGCSTDSDCKDGEKCDLDKKICINNNYKYIILIIIVIICFFTFFSFMLYKYYKSI